MLRRPERLDTKCKAGANDGHGHGRAEEPGEDNGEHVVEAFFAFVED